jgi:glycosyltransferase involved in cell wall biosynthesis
MSQKKNILLLINQLHGGGAEKVMASLSRELAKQYNITFVIYNDITKIAFPFEGKLVRIRLPFAKNPSKNPTYARFIRFIKLIYKLRQIKKQYKIEVAISFLEASNIVNVLSRRDEKLVLSVRSYLSNEFKDDARNKVFRNIIKQLYNRADYVIAPSKLIKHDLVSNFNVKDYKVAVIYNYVDREQIISQREQSINSTGLEQLFHYPVLVNVGRLTNPKGQWFLIPILKNVKRRIPNAKLLILGAGPLKDRILQLADEAGFKCYEGPESFARYDTKQVGDFDVFLPGFQSNIYPFLSRSSVFVMTSVYEGFPNVVIEGMACGLPLISSDCAAGPREIIAPETSIQHTTDSVEYAEYGILLPVLNEHAQKYKEQIILWSDVVADVLANSEISSRLRKQSLIRSDHFEKHVILEKWIDAIEN